MKTKEEIFRIKGIQVVVLHERFKIKLMQFNFAILNKDELLELINWLITKSEEM